MTSPIEAFHEQYGSEWYLFINSDLWKAAKATLREVGPAVLVKDASPAEVMQMGVVYAANMQGWSSLIAIMETMLPTGLGEPVAEPEATYTEDEPQPTRKSRSPKRRTT